MIFAMTPFTLFHVLLSLVGIATGLVVLYGWLKSDRMSGWTAVFLISTLATVITGFLFPFGGFTPAIGVGIITLATLVAALVALYRFHLAGRWRIVFLLCSTASLYLNVFVFVVQAFLKVPALNALAPTGSEPPFAAVQGVVLLAFLVAGYLAVNRFHPATA
ncbi:hypothetical protein G6N76_12020 [Rhizobium daejeonense]|uniref:DUF2306 domain-containing protein n=2 Tax=Rhizobium daejeonense TaxID=240521 RepID=A0A6M1SCB2_9HYPH|nr:hypothetical protein [Rhizobium daejeonense]NGO64396.1 hypothetical protein [Rhizobium daejeonense]